MNLIGAKVYYDGSHWIAIPHTAIPVNSLLRHKVAFIMKVIKAVLSLEKFNLII
jgi:hypothetical protein